MPKDPAGNFSLIPSYFATPGTTIRTEQHNPVLEDIAAAISSSLDRAGRNGMVGALDMGSFPIRNLSPGTATSDAATVGQGVPIGAIMEYALSTAPAGWLFCFGQALTPDTQYPLLRAALVSSGSPYGVDGANPRLPDYRGRTGVGRDNMGGTDAGRLSTFFGAVARTLGGALGAASHILTIAQIPSHDHGGNTGAAGAHDHTFPYGNRSVAPGGGAASHMSDTGGTKSVSNAPNHNHSIPAQGGGAAHPNAQPSLVVNVIIRASY